MSREHKDSVTDEGRFGQVVRHTARFDTMKNPPQGEGSSRTFVPSGNEDSVRKRSRGKRVVVFDSAWSNPYGRVISELLASTMPDGGEIECYVPVGTEPDPSSAVRLREVLPRRRSRGIVDQFRKRAAPVGCVIRALTNRDIILLATGGTKHYLVFGLAARLGVPIVYVVHNPGTDRDWNGETPAELWLGRRSTVVVHDPRWTKPLADLLHTEVVAARHPMYDSWALQYVTRKPGGRAAVMIGALRADKGSRHIAELTYALHHLDPSVRLIVAGASPPENVPEVPAECAETLDLRLGDPFLSEEDLAEAIMQSSVAVAPYSGVAFSGSIGLALSCGLDVICFESDSLSALIPQENMVPEGDVHALAARVVDYLNEPRPEGRGMGDWNDKAAVEWAAAIELARRAV